MGNAVFLCPILDIGFYDQEAGLAWRHMSRNTPKLKSLTVLAVAPNKDILNLVSAILAVDKHRVITASDEEQAYLLAREEQPDVILATSGIHNIGPRLCEKIRQNAELANTPFVLLTSSGSRRAYSSYFAHGCDQVLPIPFKCAEIYRAIENVHRKYASRSNQAIHVMLKSGAAEFVDPTTLNRLLEKHEVLCFNRKGGLAIVGRDPIRRHNRSDYRGPERRIARG